MHFLIQGIFSSKRLLLNHVTHCLLSHHNDVVRNIRLIKCIMPFGAIAKVMNVINCMSAQLSPVTELNFRAFKKSCTISNRVINAGACATG